MSLKSQLLAERLGAYHRLRGGFPIPLAGALYWLGLAICGAAGMRHGLWNLVACVASGAMFPLALLLAKISDVRFMQDRTAVKDVALPTFIGMLLFWPIAVSALWTYPTLFPLILAIGMSQHWPVIGWIYGKTFLYSAHAVGRALVCFAIWNWLPGERYMLLPLSVAAAYLVTVVAMVWDTRSRDGVRMEAMS